MESPNDSFESTREPAADQRPSAVPFRCKVCSSQINATNNEVGKEIRCPNCYVTNIVPTLPEKSAKTILVENDPDDELKLSEPTVPLRPKLEDFVDENEIASTAKELGDRPIPDRSKEGTLEKQWFSHETPSVFSIYLQQKFLVRLCWLACPLTIATFTGVTAVHLWQIEPASVLQLASSVAFLLGTVLLAIPWLTLTSVHGLSILVDTANGQEQIESWPQGPWLKWIAQAWIVVAPLVTTTTPAVAVAYWLQWKPPSLWCVLFGIPWLLFPIILLSILNANSLFVLITDDVIAKSLRHPGAWLLHYCEAVFLGVVTLSLMITCNWLAVPFGWFITAFLLAIVVMASTFLYFRLLGRLARRLSLGFHTPIPLFGSSALSQHRSSGR